MIDQEMLKAVALFENGSPELQYAYAEELGDGRGWTCGIAGFTLEEAKYFTRFFPVSAWHKADFGIRWKNACKNYTTFKSFQEHLFMELFGKPAEAVFHARHFKERTTLVALLDTVVQHGNGLDSDSFMSIVHRADASAFMDERSWIEHFLDFRFMVLSSPKNVNTRVVWRESRSRIKVLREWVADGKINLQSEVP